jgi:type VI protein secretion system component VasF
MSFLAPSDDEKEFASPGLDTLSPKSVRSNMQLDFKDTLTRLSCFALDFLEEIKNPAADVDPEECRATCIELLKAFDQPGPRAETYQSAKYALTAWIDDRLSRARWPHAGLWSARSLEQELYGTSCRNWKFFEQAELAGKREDWEALRVYQFCVAFGFRGIYAKDRIKVRLSDPLPMARAPKGSRVPILLGVLKEEASGISRGQFASGGEDSKGFSSAVAAVAQTEAANPGERFEAVMPPTLEEWSERTFGLLRGSSRRGIRSWLRLHRVLPAQEHIKDWAIVMAVGLLLMVVFFAIGH